jgi:hypothetical protein
MMTEPRKRNTPASIALTAALSLAGIVFLGASLQRQDAFGASAPNDPVGVTHFRVTNQVVLPNVTRLGINLGEQTYYDSGQMTKNLLFRNPGFEGMEYRSILHCLGGGSGTCIDSRHAFQWPAGFWDGANYEVLDGSASGQHGRVTASGPSSGGYGLSLGGHAPIGAGDWLAVSKEFPGDPTSGWWPSVQGGAHLEAERKDLSPLTAGRQALRIEAGRSRPVRRDQVLLRLNRGPILPAAQGVLSTQFSRQVSQRGAAHPRECKTDCQPGPRLS